MGLVYLDENDPIFPDSCNALNDPDGLLAFGGNLSPKTLLNAYKKGIFPWYQAGDPIMWWSPSTRCILRLDKFHVSKSLGKLIRKNNHTITVNKAFKEVLNSCSAPRDKQAGGTWITSQMHEAYYELHKLGYAHSLEVWSNSLLVGGLYGLAVNGIFSGESMFSKIPNASKLALYVLCRQLRLASFALIDCQIQTNHLLRLGAEVISRDAFLDILGSREELCLKWKAPLEIIL
ncbi:MAG: leucyl/phenylalanyl-tRNA--protein transferase [Cellvibrionales bacterium TMED49]|nr:MAG: leucyl/phenylalanyl-tRNA--protein transferase [Cellvibrionales bacterium TMED49]|tara:strand:+ start:595 stop:1293 length:699 start_codon:yes stop_codon:yes gene_type:complete